MILKAEDVLVYIAVNETTSKVRVRNLTDTLYACLTIQTSKVASKPEYVNDLKIQKIAAVVKLAPTKKDPFTWENNKYNKDSASRQIRKAILAYYTMDNIEIADDEDDEDDEIAATLDSSDEQTMGAQSPSPLAPSPVYHPASAPPVT